MFSGRGSQEELRKLDYEVVGKEILQRENLLRKLRMDTGGDSYGRTSLREETLCGAQAHL